MVILFNNKFISRNEAKISIFSEAFMFGYGVFETLRTYNKIAFRIEEHLKRLFQSAKIIGLKIETNQTDLKKMIYKVVNKAKNKNQRIKVIAIKEGIIVISTPLKKEPHLIKKGISCKSILCNRFLPQAKTLAYIDSYISHSQATAKKHYEAILIDNKKNVYEGAYSNIFWIEKNILFTRKNKILEGISRKTVIETSPYKIAYKNITLNNLLKVDEAFLTQTSKGIVPIVKIDNKKIGNGKPGEKTKKLIEAFNNFVKHYSSKAERNL